MNPTYWYKQTKDELLFPELEWSRPENQKQAGKLLIIGGSEHGFNAPAVAYNEAVAAGIGTARVLLPNKLQKTVGLVFEAGEFAPSTPSGSFAQSALDTSIDLTSWSDGVLLAGDLGKNSETAVMIERFIEEYDGQLTIAQDAVNSCADNLYAITKRPNITFVVNLTQLQQILRSSHFEQAITSTMDLMHMVEVLHEFTDRFPCNVILHHQNYALVASNSMVSSTDGDLEATNWSIKAAAYASVWWLQNPNKTFEALTTAISNI